MTDSHKGAVVAPKQPEPHPADVNPQSAAYTAQVYQLPPLIDKSTGAPVVTHSPAAEAPGKRAEEVRTERRRRADFDGESRAKLHVDKSKLDPNYAYRFINDSAGRLQELTVNDDWDIVKDPTIKSENSNEGMGVRQLVGAKQDGSPLYAYLCRKLKKFWTDDRAKKMARTNELEAQIKRGQHNAPNAASTANTAFYTPSGDANVLSQKTPSEYKP